jgi:parallel beta-helix repeat protein
LVVVYSIDRLKLLWAEARTYRYQLFVGGIMEKNITISLLIGLAVLTTCTISNPVASITNRSQDCPRNEICEATRPRVPSLSGTPTPIISPALGRRYYYVSTRGDDANSGIKALPFRTIGKAANVAKAGDVVLIQAGIYYEDVRPLYSGEPDKYITYQNEGDGEVIIDAQNGQRAGCIEIDNKSYLQIIGLTVRGANSYETWPRAGISMTDGTNHIILDNITAYNNYVGIMAYGRDIPVSFIVVKNSKTFGPVGNIGNTHYGIFFYKKVYDSSIISNHVAYTLQEVQSYGIEISTDYPGIQSNGPRRIIITGNEVDHNESQGIHTWNAAGILIDSNYLHDNGATGIQIEDGSENIVVENNISENNAQKYEFEAGAWVDNSRNVVVRNNILRSNKVGMIITDSDRVIVHDNYLYLNDRGAQNLDNAAGLIVESSATNISVTQNTFYKNGASGTQHGAVNFGLFHPTCTNITFKNNIVAETANVLDMFQDSCSGFVSDFNDFFNTRPLAVKWNQNLADWTTYMTVSGQDTNSLTSDPLFIDPAEFNFSLQTTSPLIGKGTILAWTTNASSGKTVWVTNTSSFSDGFGIGSGDTIVIGSSRVKIIGIDYINHSISVDRVINWNKNDVVSFPFTGAAPNMGAGNAQ